MRRCETDAAGRFGGRAETDEPVCRPDLAQADTPVHRCEARAATKVRRQILRHAGTVSASFDSRLEQDLNLGIIYLYNSWMSGLFNGPDRCPSPSGAFLDPNTEF